MKDKFVLGVLLVIAAVILIFSDFGAPRVRVYDCGMAEWHPDIPNSVKEECRKLRQEEWKKEQEQNVPSKKLLST